MCLLLSLLMQQKLKLKTYTTTFVKAPFHVPPTMLHYKYIQVGFLAYTI